MGSIVMHWESLLRSERHSTAATISLQAANTVDLKLFSEEAEELVDPHLPGPVYCEIRQIVSNRRTLNAIKEAVQVALCQASSVISTYDLAVLMQNLSRCYTSGDASSWDSRDVQRVVDSSLTAEEMAVLWLQQDLYAELKVALRQALTGFPSITPDILDLILQYITHLYVASLALAQQQIGLSRISTAQPMRHTATASTQPATPQAELEPRSPEMLQLMQTLEQRNSMAGPSIASAAAGVGPLSMRRPSAVGTLADCDAMPASTSGAMAAAFALANRAGKMARKRSLEDPYSKRSIRGSRLGRPMSSDEDSMDDHPGSEQLDDHISEPLGEQTATDQQLQALRALHQQHQQRQFKQRQQQENSGEPSQKIDSVSFIDLFRAGMLRPADELRCSKVISKGDRHASVTVTARITPSGDAAFNGKLFRSFTPLLKEMKGVKCGDSARLFVNCDPVNGEGQVTLRALFAEYWRQVASGRIQATYSDASTVCAALMRRGGTSGGGAGPRECSTGGAELECEEMDDGKGEVMSTVESLLHLRQSCGH